MRQSFVCSQKRNFSWIRQKTKNFSIDPHYKNRSLWNVMSVDMTLPKWAIYTMGVAHLGNVMSVDMTLPKLAIFTMGVYGKIALFLSDPAEISFPATRKVLTHSM